MTKIFQIGFNKCGTRTLFNFFSRNGVKSAHWERGMLADTMQSNLRSGRSLLHGIDSFDFFSDLEGAGVFEMYKQFDAIYASCPNSYFILNTRYVDDWIKSRMNHGDGLYAERHRKFHGFRSVDELARYWRLDWFRHHARVLEFFFDKPAQLLVFDIDRHGGNELVTFLEGHYVLDAALYRHAGKTIAGKNGQAELPPGKKRAPKRWGYSVIEKVKKSLLSVTKGGGIS